MRLTSYWVVGAIAVTIGVLVAFFQPRWLGIAEKVYGLIGGAVLTTPFFRDSRYKRILSDLHLLRSNQSAVNEAKQLAEEHVQGQVESWRPQDFRDMTIGIVFLILSYVFGAAHEILLLIEHPHHSQ